MFKKIPIKVKTTQVIHDNGLGVGRSGNMGDFNPFLCKCT